MLLGAIRLIAMQGEAPVTSPAKKVEDKSGSANHSTANLSCAGLHVTTIDYCIWPFDAAIH